VEAGHTKRPLRRGTDPRACTRGWAGGGGEGWGHRNKTKQGRGFDGSERQRSDRPPYPSLNAFFFGSAFVALQAHTRAPTSLPGSSLSPSDSAVTPPCRTAQAQTGGACSKRSLKCRPRSAASAARPACVLGRSSLRACRPVSTRSTRRPCHPGARAGLSLLGAGMGELRMCGRGRGVGRRATPRRRWEKKKKKKKRPWWRSPSSQPSHHPLIPLHTTAPPPRPAGPPWRRPPAPGGLPPPAGPPLALPPCRLRPRTLSLRPPRLPRLPCPPCPSLPPPASPAACGWSAPALWRSCYATWTGSTCRLVSTGVCERGREAGRVSVRRERGWS